MNDRTTLAALVVRLRDQRGLSQKELAARAHVGRPWLSLIEAGHRERVDPDRLRRLAAALRVPAETLLAAAGYDVAPVPIREHRPAYEIARELEASLRQAPIMVDEIPATVSAGPGAPVEAEAWPYYPRPAERGHYFVAVEVVGTCMEPRIPQGARVIVDTEASPRPGDVVVADHDGERVVKVLERREGALYLVALRNEAPIKVTEQTRILGTVVYWGKRP